MTTTDAGICPHDHESCTCSIVLGFQPCKPEPLKENVFISTEALFMELLDRLCGEADDLYEKGDTIGSQRLFDLYSLADTVRHMYTTAMDEPVIVKVTPATFETLVINAITDDLCSAFGL